MATFVFNGTENVSISNFDVTTDTIVIDGVEVTDVSSLQRSDSNFSLTLASGVVLSVSGANFASFDTVSAPSNITSSNPDLVIAIGGAAGDNIFGNLVSGGRGADQLAATTDDALIYGNELGDGIDGATFENLHLFGGSGDDTIANFGSGSVVYGGLGADQVFSAVGSVTVYGGNGSSDSTDTGDVIFIADGDNLVYSNAGNDTIQVGGTGDNMLFGGQGDDTVVSGSTGDDSLFGNTGNDFLAVQGGGDDFVYGGQGNDTISVAGGDAPGDDVLLSGGLGSDTIDASNSNSENITVYGGNGASDASDGGDSILGSAAADLIYGNGGDDTIIGSGGDDEIFGGAGNDTIAGGGAGNASFTGGAGNDAFGGNTNAGVSEDYATVTDFTQGIDLIVLNGANTPTNFSTVTTATDFDTFDGPLGVYDAFGATLAAGASIAVVVTVGDLAGQTFVLSDTDGALGADEVIALTGFTGVLTAADFA